MNILVIGDCWDELERERDSSLHLLRVGAQKFRVRAWWATPQGIFARAGVLMARAARVRFQSGEAVSFARQDKKEFALRDFDRVLWRCDPPVGLETYRLWALLASDPKLRVWNQPAAMGAWNEKFALLRYPRWAIPSTIVNSAEILRAELRRASHGGKRRLLIKPCAAAASFGIQILSKNPVQAVRQFQSMERRYGPIAVVQDLDERIHELGELRFFAIGGRIVSAVQKFPGSKDPIMNWYAKKAEQPLLQMASPATEGYCAALVRARAVARDLWRDGIYLGTVDFIGERILEINVTSPGLLKWVDEVGRFTLDLGGVPHQLADVFWKGILRMRRAP